MSGSDRMMVFKKKTLIVLIIGIGIIVWNGSVLAEQYYSQSRGRDILIVLDASNSMNDRTPSGETKMHVAKEALNNFLDGLASSDRVGLIVFYDCGNIQTKVPLTKNHDSISTALENVHPSGYTPIADSLEYAWDYLKHNAYSGNSWYIILLTDGEETCKGEPCSLVKSISQEFDTCTKAPVFAIGFFIDSNSKGEKDLQCIAHATGGKYFSALSADELGNIFKGVSIAIGYRYLKIIAMIIGAIVTAVVVLMVEKEYFSEGKYIDVWTVVHFLVGIILGVVLRYSKSLDIDESFFIAALLLIFWEKIEPRFWPGWHETLENQVCDVIVGLDGFLLGYLFSPIYPLIYSILLIIYSVLRKRFRMKWYEIKEKGVKKYVKNIVKLIVKNFSRK